VATGLNGPAKPQGTRDGSKAQKPVLVALPSAFGRVDGQPANGTWVSPGRNAEALVVRRKLRRVNPKSAADLKQGRQGQPRRKPPRGWSNPEGGTGGQAKPVVVDSVVRKC